MNPLPFLPGVPDDLAEFLRIQALRFGTLRYRRKHPHLRDPREKRKTLARRRAANKVARASRRLNRRLQRTRS